MGGVCVIGRVMQMTLFSWKDKKVLLVVDFKEFIHSNNSVK